MAKRVINDGGSNRRTVPKLHRTTHETPNEKIPGHSTNYQKLQKAFSMYSDEYRQRAARADAERKRTREEEKKRSSQRKTNPFDAQDRGLPLSRTLDIARRGKK